MYIQEHYLMQKVIRQRKNYREKIKEREKEGKDTNYKGES